MEMATLFAITVVSGIVAAIVGLLTREKASPAGGLATTQRAQLAAPQPEAPDADIPIRLVKGWQAALPPAARVIRVQRVPRLLMRYQDSGNRETERVIEIKRLILPPDPGATQATHIVAHCHLRGDIRMFRTDRIISMADAATGEVLPNLDLSKFRR